MSESLLQSRALTILHVRASNFFGGPEKQVLEHCIEGQKAGYRMLVASFALEGMENDFLSRCRSAGIHVLEISQQSKVDISMVGQLSRFASEYRVDALCAHGYKAAVLAWLVRRRMRLPFIAFSRGRTSEGIKVSLYQWIEEQFMRRADKVIAVSRSEFDRLRSRISPEKLVYVPNAVRTVQMQDRLETLAGLPRIFDVPRIVSIGRLSEEKGHRFLIEAIRRAIDSGHKCHAVICGDGPIADVLRQRVQALRLQRDVTFSGFRHDVADVYRWADIVVLPSLSEGLPNVVLEAMAAQRLVVATNVGGVPDLISHDQTGYLAAAGDSADLAEKIALAIRRFPQRDNILNAARSLVDREYSFEAQFVRLTLVYRTVTGSPPSES